MGYMKSLPPPCSTQYLRFWVVYFTFFFPYVVRWPYPLFDTDQQHKLGILRNWGDNSYWRDVTIISLYRDNFKKIEFTTSICLKLLELCVRDLSFRNNLEIICLAIRLFLKSVQKQRKHIKRGSSDKGDHVKESECDKLLSTATKFVRDRLMKDLYSRMTPHYDSMDLIKELQVSVKFNKMISWEKRQYKRNTTWLYNKAKKFA